MEYPSVIRHPSPRPQASQREGLLREVHAAEGVEAERSRLPIGFPTVIQMTGEPSRVILRKSKLRFTIIPTILQCILTFLNSVLCMRGK